MAREFQPRSTGVSSRQKSSKKMTLARSQNRNLDLLTARVKVPPAVVPLPAPTKAQARKQTCHCSIETWAHLRISNLITGFWWLKGNKYPLCPSTHNLLHGTHYRVLNKWLSTMLTCLVKTNTNRHSTSWTLKKWPTSTTRLLKRTFQDAPWNAAAVSGVLKALTLSKSKTKVVFVPTQIWGSTPAQFNLETLILINSRSFKQRYNPLRRWGPNIREEGVSTAKILNRTSVRRSVRRVMRWLCRLRRKGQASV